LLLRGPQTPGELRTRTECLCKFVDVREVENTLDQLMQRDDGPFVAKLPREPGKRDSRYAHLFGSEPGTSAAVAQVAAVSEGSGEGADRIEQLEQLVDQLRAEVAVLKARLDQIAPDQEPGSPQ
jgi:uncharacterized protein